MVTDAVIQSLQTEDKILVDYFEKIPKKNKKTEKKIIESSVRLAYVLFFSGEQEAAKQIVARISKIPFANSYDYWVWIEAALVLKGVIAEKEGDVSSYESSLDTVSQALKSGSEVQVSVKANVHKRFLEGQTLDISFYEENNPVDAFEMRIEYVMSLLKMYIFGGSDSWTLKRIKDELEKVGGEIRAAIVGKGIYSFPPFL